MSTLCHRPSFRLLSALAVSMLLGSCTSSGPDGDQNPGQTGGGSVPARFALFLSDLSSAGETEATLVDLETDEMRTLTGQIPAGHRIVSYASRLSPDGRYLAFTTEDSSVTRFRVLSVANGSMVTLPFSSTGSGGTTDGGPGPAIFQFSPDGARLLLSFQEQGFGGYRTVVMDSDGRNHTEFASGQYSAQPVAWLPDSSAFVADLVDPVDFNHRPFLVDATTMNRTALGPVLGSYMDIDRIEISRDGTALAYLLEYEVGTTYEYAVVGVDLVAGVVSVFDSFTNEPEDDFLAISDDGSAVAFVTEDSATLPEQVWVGDMSTGALNLANGPIVGIDASVYDIAWEPGGSRLAYLADHRDLDVEELFLTNVQGISMPIEATLILDSDVESFAWSPAGGTLAFVFDDPGSSSDQVFLYDANAAGMSVLVAGGLSSQGAGEFLWAPDGAWLYVREFLTGVGDRVVAFRADDLSQSRDLGPGWDGSSVSSFGGTTFTRLVPYAGAGGVAEAVWVRYDNATSQRELVIGSPDGPGAPRRISPLPGPSGGDQFNEIFLR